MNRRTRTLAATSATLSLLTVLAGCGRPAAAPSAQPSPSPAVSSHTPRPDAAPAVPAPSEETTGAGQAPTPSPAHRHEVPVRDVTSETDQLRLLMLADHPTGTGPQIALRFLQALQDGADLRAAHELYVLGRSLLAQHDMPFLHRVMRDVASNARLDRSGPCTTAERLTADAAVVICGEQHVVVHVLDGPYGSGVQLSDRHPAFDVYAGPHSHAFTTIQP
jgi:hypothetical protein